MEKRRNFSVSFLNYSGGTPFRENGCHMTTTDQELLDWFVACRGSSAWQKTSDITITEKPATGKDIDRADLVKKIIEAIALRKNQQIVLDHLNAVTNKNLHIPIIALNKSYSWARLREEVVKLSDTGKVFIKEMLENIEEMKSALEKK